jgi:PAS domain S-box-containing protein
MESQVSDDAGAGAGRGRVPEPVPAHQPASALGEEAFSLLVEAVVDYAIFLLDPEGNVLSWNLGAERIKGYRADEIIGRHFSVFYTPEAARAGLPARILRSATLHGRHEDEGWRVRKDGSRFWADVVVTALLDPAGQLAGFAKVTRDMTERRAAAEREKLLDIERERRAAAEGALRARERFLSVAAHELRTPVASLQLATELLARSHRRGSLDDERLSRSLIRIDGAIKRVTSLVTELLDVSRLEAGAISFDAAPVDLEALLREIAARFDDDGGGDRLQLDADATVIITGSAERLDQVFSNLIDNALKYSSPSSPVTLRLRGASDGATIEVVDGGIGLSEDLMDRLFEPFERGANAAHVPGMGLGLYLCRQIVEGHGGRISAAGADSGSGTVVTVWLPNTPPPTTSDTSGLAV